MDSGLRFSLKRFVAEKRDTAMDGAELGADAGTFVYFPGSVIPPLCLKLGAVSLYGYGICCHLSWIASMIFGADLVSRDE